MRGGLRMYFFPPPNLFLVEWRISYLEVCCGITVHALPRFFPGCPAASGHIRAAHASANGPAPQEKPAWDVRLKPNAQATSNLDIENRCRGAHNFNIIKQDDLDFLEFVGPPQIRVAGYNSDKLPVRFNTRGMTAGQYLGNLLVRCLDCRAEPTCSQDREVLPVRLTIAPDQSPHPTRNSLPLRLEEHLIVLCESTPHAPNEVETLVGK